MDGDEQLQTIALLESQLEAAHKTIASLEGDLESLRAHHYRANEASLRIIENIDLDTVLQDVVDAARTLTGARYGGITAIEEDGQWGDMFTSGLSPEQDRLLYAVPGRVEFFAHLLEITQGTVTINDIQEYARQASGQDFELPVPAYSMMVAPCRNGGKIVGLIYLSSDEGDSEFTPHDEETLALFGSAAALVISNARRYAAEQKAKARVETLLDTSPVGVAVFNVSTDAEVVFNREATRIFDTLRSEGEPHELIRQVTVRRSDGREYDLAGFPSMQAMLNIAEKVRTEEMVISVPDGRAVTALINSTPIYGDDGQVESVVVTMQDMSQVKDLERLRAELLGVVSHELRAPLYAIRGATATGLDPARGLAPAELQQLFETIDSSAAQMHDLVRDLTDVANIETGTLRINPEPTDLVRMMDQARDIFLSGSGSHSLQFNLEAQVPFVMADRQRIVQVLTNLLLNAATHSVSTSPIRVGASPAGVHVEVYVEDEGSGISEEQMLRLFRKFSDMGPRERAGEYLGAGLGLAICKGIVEAHGGRIWATSDGPGKGARFTFTLPVAVPDLLGSRVRPEWHESVLVEVGETPRVLAVEDNPTMLRYIRDSLERAGYFPIVTGDPVGAVRLMMDSEPHLLLLDVKLPGTDGIELMRELLTIADVPVIFLSAYGEDDIVSSAYEMGASDYIVKPFSPAELAARIAAALRKRETGIEERPAEPFEFGDLRIDYAERRVTLAGETLRLTETEYRMLSELAKNAGVVLSYEHLMRRVWRRQGTDLRPMRTVVKGLRRKLGESASSPMYLFTAPRVGYRLAGGIEGATAE